MSGNGHQDRELIMVLQAVPMMKNGSRGKRSQLKRFQGIHHGAVMSWCRAGLYPPGVIVAVCIYGGRVRKI